MPTSRTSFLLVVLACLLAPSAGAAPIARTADLSLTIRFPFIRDALFPYGGAPSSITATATGATVSVDPAARSISLAAGAVALTSTVSVPVTGNTSITRLTSPGFANAGGTFFVGGAAGVPGEPPCPVAAGVACVGQSGFGGTMGVTGALGFQLFVGTFVTLPLDLGDAQLGLGGSGSVQIFTQHPFDAAPWTIGTGAIQVPGTTLATTTAGSVTASGIRLVSPNYLASPFPGSQVMVGILDIEFTDGLGVPSFVLEVVPEPEGFVLIGLGALALGLLLMRDRSDD